MSRAALLGLYFPIVFLAAAAAALLLLRLVLPALREGHALVRYAIGVGAAFSLMAHVVVHAAGWGVRMGHFGGIGYPVLWAIAGLTLAACVSAMAGLSHAITGRARLGMILTLAAVLWAIGTGVSA